MTNQHFEELYCKLYEAHKECVDNGDETYAQKIGIVLDHMIYNKPYLYLK